MTSAHPKDITLSSSPIRRVDHLLKVNHTEYSILYNKGHFHNHSPHFLAAAHLLGASDKQLDAIYNDAVKRDILEPWTPSQNTITVENHREYLAKPEYQREWVDFFDSQTRATKAWQELVVNCLLSIGASAESAPLLNCLIAGLGHPLIHLGYAFELKSRTIAIEALGLAATCYDRQLSPLLYIPNSSSSSYATPDLFEIFSRVHNDESLPSFSHPGDSHINSLLDNEIHRDLIVRHLRSWTVTDPKIQLNQASQLAALILISTSPRVGGHGYDFFLVHILTAAHAVGSLFPFVPAENQPTLLRQWLLMSLLVYVAQQRPRLDPDHIKSFDLQGRDWGFVRTQALEGNHASDAHFVKACQAMVRAGAGAVQGSDEEKWFLTCAVMFSSEFEVWSGFDPDGEGAEEKRRNRLKDGIHV